MSGLNDLLSDSDKLAVPSLGSAIGGGSNKELMAEARMALSGMWGRAVLGFVAYTLLMMSFMAFVLACLLFASARVSSGPTDFMTRFVALSPVVQVVVFFVSGAFVVGFAAFFLKISQEGEARFEHLFVGFKRFWKSLGVYFFYGLFVFLWSLLLVIPGIIATFRYAMAFYILADDEDCGPLEAISRSKEMMKGRKWKFFCLHWRFFGWALLSSLLPFGYLWLVPYMQTSFAKFYEDVS